MNDLVERYVHQVGRYLSRKDRADIEAELRSQIQDQLDDRYGGSPSDEQVTRILAEFGHPYKMAISYSTDQYLVGPDFYPFMMMVLRYGWLVIPLLVLFVNIFGVLISPEPSTLLTLVIEPVLTALQVTFIFSAIVVLIFALIERSNLEFGEETSTFNPVELPEVDDPRPVDRVEAAFGIAFGTFVGLMFLYFLRVGGLTLRFDLNNPGTIIPVPVLWIILTIIAIVAMLILHMVVLRRNRWNVGLWLIQTMLEVIGVVCMYFVLYKPLHEPIITAFPVLINLPFINNAPEIIAVLTAMSTVITRGNKLAKLWNYDSSNIPTFSP